MLPRGCARDDNERGRVTPLFLLPLCGCPVGQATVCPGWFPEASGATADSSARCAGTQARLEITGRLALETARRLVYIRASVPLMSKTKIAAIVLAAGPARFLRFPKALAPFAGRTALEIAVVNCAELKPVIVVLGCDAARIRRAVPCGVRVVVNRRWRTGQLSSLLAALRWVPQGTASLVYPVDHPLLTRAVVRKLCRAFARRSATQTIVLPIFQGRVGHPAIFAPQVHQELRRARTAREVVYRDLRRVKFVKMDSPGIWLDFATPASYRRCLREYERKLPARRLSGRATARSAGRSRKRQR